MRRTGVTLPNRRTCLVAVLAVALILVAAVSLAGVGCGTSEGGTTMSQTPTGVGTRLAGSVSGAGATFPKPLYIEWIGEFQNANPDVKIDYQGIGSGGGIEQLTKMTVDFGASDAPMKDEEIAAAEAASGAGVLHIPTVFGAVVCAYNLKGIQGLKLDNDVLAGIFLGTIEDWNDARIAALNPGIALPDEAIQVVHRSDSSGTTNIFTSYLDSVSSEWSSKVGKGKEVKWPVGIGGQGNDGVSAVVKQQATSIGYVELSYAIHAKLTMAALKNQAGNFVTPSLESTSAAAVGVTFPADLRFSLNNSEASEAYPIVGATWILAYDKMKDPVKADTLRAWLTWALNDGAVVAEELGYASLPDELRTIALEKVDAIGTF